MKTTAVLVGIFAILGVPLASPHGELYPNEPRIFEDLINSTFNIAVAAIAKFDPLDVKHHEHNRVTHGGEINNLHLEGFSNIIATHIKLSGLIVWILELTVEAPKIFGTLEHWEHHSIHFYGEGNARVEINDAKMIIRAKINPLTVHVKDLEITPSIGSANVSITGLYNNEKLSQRISDRINEILNERVNNDTELHQRISGLVLKLIQSISGLILG